MSTKNDKIYLIKRKNFRFASILYLVSLALLPWSWFPPFPWLHEHAQWSDAVFALATVAWAIDLCWTRRWKDLNAIHLMSMAYLAAALLSLVLGSSNPRLAAFRWFGTAELFMLLVVTSDLTADPSLSRSAGRVVALTSFSSAIASILGLLLFYAGMRTHLVGIYGDLIPSRYYARVEGGTYNPNVLASYYIFASAVVAQPDSGLTPWQRRAVQLSLWLTVLLTFSRGILGFGTAALIRRATSRSRKLLAAAVAVVSAAVMVALSVWNLSLDPSRPWAIHFDQSQPSSRLQSITSSFQTLFAHPLFGSGLGTPPGTYRGAPINAHLTPLNIAAKLGLPALLAFAIMIVLIWRRRSRPTDLATWSGLAGLALDGLAQDVSSFRHVWVMLGFAARDIGDRRAEGEGRRAEGRGQSAENTELCFEEPIREM